MKISYVDEGSFFKSYSILKHFSQKGIGEFNQFRMHKKLMPEFIDSRINVHEVTVDARAFRVRPDNHLKRGTTAGLITSLDAAYAKKSDVFFAMIE